MSKNKSSYGYDNATHHLIQLKIPPPSLVALREELAKHYNKDIFDEANKGKTFEECIGTIASMLDIVLDGGYDGAELCDVIVSSLRKRNRLSTKPHLRDSRLVRAEVIEREKSLEIVEGPGTLVPNPDNSLETRKETEMPTPMHLVIEFHKTYEHHIQPFTRPKIPTDSRFRGMRLDLIKEELSELEKAEFFDNLVEVADALGDLVYVIYGMALAYGIDLDKVLEEIHRSNMTKLGEDGKVIKREDGKVLKGPNYQKPDIAKVLGLKIKEI